MAKSDMFLKLESKAGGAVKGETDDALHPGEIDVIDWSWGMGSSESIAGAGAALKTSLSELRIVKRVDMASTALMSVMRNNDLVTKATLSIRKAGGANPLDYLKITIQKGRISHYEVGGTAAEGHELIESLSIAFESIEVQYKLQDASGGQKAATTFQTQVR